MKEPFMTDEQLQRFNEGFEEYRAGWEERWRKAEAYLKEETHREIEAAKKRRAAEASATPKTS